MNINALPASDAQNVSREEMDRASEEEADAKAKDKKQAEERIQKMWHEAADKFQNICGESLMIGDIRSFEDVEQRIKKADEDPNPNDERGHGWTRARELGLKSLDMLKVLVVVTKMASSVLPIPEWATNIAGNALCKVFDIGRNLENYSAAINDVFSEVSSSLAQFHIYEDLTKHYELPLPLLIRIQEVLFSVVVVCAHVTKYRQGKAGYKWKTNLKAAWGNDSGLAEAMKDLEKLSRRQKDLQGTVTLSKVIETNQDLKQLLKDHCHYGKLTEEIHDGVQYIYDYRRRVTTLLNISSSLGVPHVLDSKTTPECTRIHNSCLNQTGDWIWKLDTFKEWADPSKINTPHVLLISGAASSGKTSASAMITRKLEGKGGRVYVANHFFASSDTNTVHKQTTDSIDFAIKSMAFQIARIDPTVQVALGKLYDGTTQQEAHSIKGSSGSGLTELEILWKRMTIGNTPGAAYFLVFDGIDRLPDDQQENFLKFLFSPTLTGGTGCVRILVSGLHVDAIAKHDQAREIKMEEHNDNDIKLFIRDALGRDSILRSAPPGSDKEKAREAIIEKLPGSVNGQYSLLSFALQKVMALLTRQTDLNELNDMLDDPMIMAGMVVQQLEKSLSPSEIKELNELLKWVVHSRYTLSVYQLESVWLLHSDRKPIASLEEIIKSTYGAIFVLSNDGRITTTEGIKAYLKQRNQSLHKTSKDKEQPTISMTITISRVDKEVCGHFLWDVARGVIRDQFKFDDTLLTSNSHAVIVVDEAEAHHHIIMKSLDYLLRKPTGKPDDIGKYLVSSLPYHLQRLQKIDQDGEQQVPDDQLSVIAQKLHDLFKNSEVLGRHKNSFAGTYWRAGQLPTFKQWCLALEPRRPPKSLDAAWVNKVKEATSPMEGFLDEWTKTIVKEFVMGREWRVLHAWWWVEEFLEADQTKFQFPSTSSIGSTDVLESSSGRSSNETYWRRVDIWCQRILKVDGSELKSLWYERLAQIARRSPYASPNEVISLLQRAIESPEPSWTCYRDLAEVYHEEDKDKEAIDTAQKALKRFAEGTATPRIPTQDVLQLRLTLADWTYGAKRVDESWNHYAFVAASQDATSQQAKLARLGSLKASLSLSHERKTRNTLIALMNEKSKASMTDILYLFAEDREHDSLMSNLLGLYGQDEDLLQSILRQMEIATLEDIRDETSFGEASNENFKENAARGVLLNDRAVAAYFYQMLPKQEGSDSKDPTQEALNLWMACLNKLPETKGYNDYMAKKNAISALANHYFQKGMASTEDREECAFKLWDLAYHQAIAINGDTIAFLGALYAPSNNSRSRHFLRPKVKGGLRLLSDFTPENDEQGFHMIARTHLLSNDFRNAAAAVSLRSQGDFVTEAIALSLWDGKKDLGSPAAQDLADKIGKCVLQIATRSPGSEHQSERIKAALKALPEIMEQVTFQSLPSVMMDTATRKKHETSDVDGSDLSGSLLPLTAWKTRLQSQLETFLQRAMTFDETRSRYCDGHLTGGKTCQKYHNFATTFFNCIYCWDKDFCESCLSRLRNPNAEVKVTACNANHKWLKLPPLGDDIYLGTTAKTLRLNRMIKATTKDKKVFEIVFDQDWDEPEMTIETWKQRLADDWDISMAEIES